MDLNEEVAEADENQIKMLEDTVKTTLEDYFKTVAILFENDEYILFDMRWHHTKLSLLQKDI